VYLLTDIADILYDTVDDSLVTEGEVILQIINNTLISDELSKLTSEKITFKTIEDVSSLIQNNHTITFTINGVDYKGFVESVDCELGGLSTITAAIMSDDNTVYLIINGERFQHTVGDVITTNDLPQRP